MRLTEVLNGRDRQRIKRQLKGARGGDFSSECVYDQP